eukprot:6768331-Pyramimonas_sp.AAC.1
MDRLRRTTASTSMSSLASPNDLVEHFDLVEAADLKEIKQFVEANVWKPISLSQCKQEPVDCVWVRKWKQIK